MKNGQNNERLAYRQRSLFSVIGTTYFFAFSKLLEA